MLNSGDMAVLGWSALDDTITFTTLVDLPSGTVIKLTDKGWNLDTSAFTPSATGDGVITWVVSHSISAGNVFILYLGGADEATTLQNITTNEDLTADTSVSTYTAGDPMTGSGDGVFIYQGDDSNPYFIFGMNNSAGIVDSTTNWNMSIDQSLRDSMLPNGTGSQNTLTNGANAIGLPGGASQLDNVQYTGPTGIADKATWLARITDISNWTGDDTGFTSNATGSSVQIAASNAAPVFTTPTKASVAENTTAVTTLAATDADGDTLTYSLAGGADQALFTLDANSGALSFKSAPNFEAPADSNSDNIYTVEVSVSDDRGGSTPLTLEVTVTNVNEAPTLTGATKISVAENSTGTLYTALASDPENDALTYTLSGTDAALFTLDANSGALSFKSAPDFEAPADAGGNNVYDVTLTASDGSLDSTPQALAIIVTNANETPIFTTPTKASVAENTTAVTTLAATDADGDTLTYSLAGGADQALFALDANSGALSFKSAPNFEAPADSNSDNIYTVEVSVSDDRGGNTPLTLEVTVTNVNEAPALTGATKISVAENSTGTLYTALASDPENDALTYTLSGTDAALFTLDANSGALSFKSAPDFEAPADAGGNNVYDVTLTASDGSLDSTPQALAIIVTNANETPIFTTPTKASVAENTTAVTTLAATDADGDLFLYSLTGGADQALFTLDANSGALSFKSAPNFEAPADSNSDNIYTVEVSASDDQGGSTPLTLEVTVTNVNEAPTLTGATKISVAENSTGTLYTATASDPENDTLTYTLSGTDAALFTLDANSGALSFKNSPDFEAPADAGGNNVYDVTLTASDGSLSSTPQALAIIVTDVDDSNEAPVFTTPTKASVAENTTAVTTLAATDADGDLFLYSLTGGADQALFTLDANSGALSFKSAPNFEAPADSNSDNIYTVEVSASDDQGGITPLTLEVTVTNVNEAPTLAGATKISVAENSTGTLYTALASDPENDALTYTLSGTDAALFTLDANSGALSFKSAPDFEAPADAGGNNVYDVTLTASDGSLSSAPQALAITVTDVNEAPVFTTANKANVAENTTAVATLAATDADGDLFLYSLTGGADQALFTLDASSGALSFKSAPNFEAPADSNSDNIYTVEVSANDGQGGSTPLTLEVTVTDVNEAPTLTGATKISVAENSTGTLYTATASDPENNALTYALSGTDAALFTLDANSGELSFKNAPDFEAPADAGGNNVYDVILTASDGSLSSASQALAITVTDVNEAPVFTTANKASVAENTTAVTTLVATDADGDTLTYSLTGGADQALFTLDASSGALSFKSAPNFEAPADSNSDNIYTVEVSANDGQGGSMPLTLEVTVTDINETSPPPIIPPVEPQPPTVPDPIAVTPGASQPNTPSGNISISEIITNNGTSSGSVRLVENTGNTNIVTATLPGRVSLQHDGSRTATDQDSALADLIASIVGKSPANMLEQTNVASQWLSSLAEGTFLDIRTLTFSAIEPITTPIVLTGNASNNSLSSHIEAFVIDTSALAAGTLLQLDNIEFASIVGNAVITGGSGNNIVIGDDAAQSIVLGEGDDALYGGGGDDVIGSEGGDDRLFGDNGNDELFGGAGADLLHGGRDVDVASYQGSRDDYVVTQLHSVITVSRRDDPSDVDTLINIETLRFTDDEENLSYANDLGWIAGLYAQVLGRQGDVEGVQYWAQRHEEGMSKADMALLFINSVEAGEQLTTQDQSTETILDILYQSLLDREADAEGKAYWADKIDSGVSLLDVAEGFMASDEMRTHDLAHTQWDFFV